MVIGAPNRRYKQNVPDIKINIDLRTLDILCRYILSSSRYVKINHIVNMRKMIEGLNPSTYEADVEKSKRIKFIRKGIEARLDYKLKEAPMILTHILNGLEYDVDFLDLDNVEMDRHAIDWVNNMVSETLQYSFIYESADKMLDICTRLKSTDYEHRGEIIREYENMIDQQKTMFRKSRISDNITNLTFSLRPGDFENGIEEVYNTVTNPARRLICGMQGVNEITGGGFENGRVYMLFGLTGVGKSLALLNIAYQMKMFNRNYKTKDPTKIPCIVILTQENTVIETVTRLFDLCIRDSIGMANYALNEVIEKLKTEGQLVINQGNPINLFIVYKPDKSIDTSYLYGMVDDLEDDGYEVICLIQDHIKKLRSMYNYQELRIELGEIVNELKIFAADKDIPVISNSHLNREAARIVEEATAKGNMTDITSKLGKANIGESMLMLDNLDLGIIIGLDFDEQGNRMMAFNTTKLRDKAKRTYIVQPFEYGSSIRLATDVGGVPVFREALHTQKNQNIQRQAGVRTSASNVLGDMNFGSTNSFINDGIYALDETGYVANQHQYDILEQEEHQIDMPKIIKPLIFVEKPKPSVSIQEMKEILEQRRAEAM